MILYNQSARYVLIMILTFIPFFSEGQNEFNLVPEPFPIPLDSIKQLSYLVPILGDNKHLDSNIVIIYGFTGCKPCEILQKKIQNKIDNKKIDNTSILYVNIFVLDTTKLISQLHNKNISFTYYATESPYIGPINGSFPIISAYLNGGKQWSIFGYSPYNTRKILEYVRKI